MGKKKTEANGTNGHAGTTPAPADGIERTERRRFTQDLPCRLSDEKLAEHRASLVAVTTERVETEARVALLREAIKGHKTREESLVGKIQHGTEDAPVECTEYLLPDNSVQTVRNDTGEVVGVRTADAEDLQDDLFDEDDVPGAEHHDTPGGEEAELSEDHP